MLILSPVTDNYSERLCRTWEIEPAKLPNIRLDTLQKTGLLNTCINGLHQLGLLTSKECPDLLLSLY